LTDNLEERALALIKSKPRGILQSELWKDLEIDSRKCSRVVAKLDAEGKVRRTWETVSGTRTYRLSYIAQKKEAPRKEYQFELIMAEDVVAPCVGCTYECEPDYCPDLGNWIELLAKEAARRPAKAVPQKIAAEEAGLPAPEEPEVIEEIVVPEVKTAKAVKATKKGKALPEPEKAPVKPVKAVKKGKALPEPEEAPVKPVKAVKKGKALPEPEETPEEVEEVKPAKKGKAIKESKPVNEAKAVPKAPEVKGTKKAPAKKRK